MIKNVIILFSFFLVGLGLVSCGSTAKEPKLDLMSYGLPIAISAPAASEVKVDDLGVWKDVTVKYEDSYFVQILSSKATSLDIDKLKSASLAEVKAGRYFSKIIQEDDKGFIFEKKIDESINYDFRFFKIQGDQEYSFQTGLIGTFSEEQVRDMYNSVQ